MHPSKILQNIISELDIKDEVHSEIYSDLLFIRNRLNEVFQERAYSTEQKQAFFIGSYARGTEILQYNINILYVVPHKFMFLNDDMKKLHILISQALKPEYEVCIIEKSKFVKVSSPAGVSYKILFAHINSDNSYTYRLSSESNLWSVTNPLTEIVEYKKVNEQNSDIPNQIAKLLRLWKYSNNIDCSGYLLDTLVYHYFKQNNNYNVTCTSLSSCLRGCMQFIASQSPDKYFWLSPGAKHYVVKTSDIASLMKSSLDSCDDENASFNDFINKIFRINEIPEILKQNHRT